MRMYWRDPDGNVVETQCDGMGVGEAGAFMESEAYRVNPVGVEFVPEEVMERMRAGEVLEELVRRGDVGARGLDSVRS